MKFKALCVLLFLGGLWPTKASADNRFIVRTTLDLQTLQTVCNPPLLPPICTVVGGLGDPLGQLFLITSPLDLHGLLDLPGNPLGIVRAEVDRSEEHTSELQSLTNIVCRLLLEKKK